MINQLGIVSKMVLAVSISSITIILGSSLLIYTHLQSKNEIESQELALKTAQTIASQVQAKLNQDISTARTLAHHLDGLQDFSSEERKKIQNRALKKFIEKNHSIHSVWVNWELWAIDSLWKKEYGRHRIIFSRTKENKIDYINERISLEGYHSNPSYYNLKKWNQEWLMEPHEVSYPNSDKNILQSSICIPIQENKKFIGVMGFDFDLIHYSNILSSHHSEEYELYLNDHLGQYVAATQDQLKSSSIFQEYPEDFQTIESLLKNQGNESHFFRKVEDQMATCFIPIRIGQSDQHWLIGVKYSLSNHWKANMDTFFWISLYITLGYFLTILFIGFVIKQNVQPIINIRRNIKRLSKGEIEQIETIHENTKDEFFEISNSLNKLIKGLKKKQQFATSIGKGDLNQILKIESEQDLLGKELLRMQRSLKDSKKKEKEEKWLLDGLSQLNHTLNHSQKDINEFSALIIKKLTQVLSLNQGALFIVNQENKEQKYLELKGCYAYDRLRHQQKRIIFGDGLIGQAALEKEPTILNELPDQYTFITSGLGQSTPTHLVIYPLIFQQEIYGVLELASFKYLTPIGLQLLKIFSESLALEIKNTHSNNQTKVLLKKTQEQTLALKEKEKELNQNIEELRTSQDQNRLVQEKIHQQGINLQAIVDGFHMNVFAINLDYEVIAINKALKDRYKGTAYEVAAVGKNITDYQTQDLIDEWVPIYTRTFKGEEIELLKKIIIKNSETYRYYRVLPLKDGAGKVIGSATFSDDITNEKDKYLAYLTAEELIIEEK